MYIHCFLSAASNVCNVLVACYQTRQGTVQLHFAIQMAAPVDFAASSVVSASVVACSTRILVDMLNHMLGNIVSRLMNHHADAAQQHACQFKIC